MEIGTFMEELAYGDKSFKDKSVWITQVSGGKIGKVFFSVPYSMMIPNRDGKAYKIVEYRAKKYVLYKMTKGMHNSCHFGKKKSDGKTRMFKSTKNYGNTGNSGSSGSRQKSNKQYFCKTCQKQVFIERDGQNNAYCTDCGTKMFG